MVKKVISRKYGRTLIQYPVILPSHPSNNKSICLIYYFSNCGHEYVLKTLIMITGGWGWGARTPSRITWSYSAYIGHYRTHPFIGAPLKWRSIRSSSAAVAASCTVLRSVRVQRGWGTRQHINEYDCSEVTVSGSLDGMLWTRLVEGN